MIVGSFVGYTRSFHHFICVITRILLFTLFLQHIALFPDRWRSVYKVGWWSALFLVLMFFSLAAHTLRCIFIQVLPFVPRHCT